MWGLGFDFEFGISGVSGFLKFRGVRYKSSGRGGGGGCGFFGFRYLGDEILGCGDSRFKVRGLGSEP